VTKPSGEIYTWSEYGSLRWELCLCLLLSWIIICLMLIKGLKAYGKIAIVITLMPYVVLTALLIYSVQLVRKTLVYAYCIQHWPCEAMYSV
jgi:hypothetical protein